MRIEELLDRPQSLPTIPKVVQQLIESFNDEDVTAGRIAAQIETDPVLSAKLLRLANSAFFNVSRTVATVNDALNLLGFVMVRNMVLGSGIAGAFKVSPGMDAPGFWHACLATACAARWLAPRAGQGADIAFTVGLMHGIGHFVLHAGLPEAMAKIDAAIAPLDVRRAAEERRRLGYDFAQVGAELARRWRFPESMAAAMAAVPAPLDSEPFNGIAAVVHLAAWSARRDALATDDRTDPRPDAVCDRLGLSPDCLGAGAGTARQPEGTGARSRSDTGARSKSDTSEAIDVMPPIAELTRGLETMLA
jgi:HD-like signal output (HDOD) protein